MSLETEIAGLTTATNNLVAAVNVSKAILDAKAAEATTAATTATEAADAVIDTANLLSAVAVVSAASTVVLTSASAVYQFINPNTASRDVTLPVLTTEDSGRVFCIKNTGTTGVLAVKYNAVLVGFSVSSQLSLTVVWTGTNWEAI